MLTYNKLKRLLGLFLLVLSIVSCQKDKLQKGLYYANTVDGMLYVELQKGGDCVLFFQGGEENDGRYDMSKGKITVLGHTSIKIDNVEYSWWFYDKGTINGDSFKVQVQRTYSTKYEYHYLTFYKH